MKSGDIFLAILLGLISNTAMAKPVVTAGISQADEDQIDRMAEALFSNLRTKNTDNGIKQFFGSSSLMTSKSDQLKLLVDQIDSAIGLYGTVGTCENVETTSEGTLVEYRRYVCQHTNMLTSWNMSFFKTSKGWIAANLYFKDQPPKQ